MAILIIIVQIILNGLNKMKKEYWKPVVGYEGLYMVSNCGRIKSLDTYRKGKNGSIRFCKGKILKPGTTKNGYLLVGLYKNGKVKFHLVHRLVAEAFLPNPDNLPEVNHKDEDKTNNNVENLEFCDRTYNANYGTGIERQKKKQLNDIKKSKSVLQYDLEGNFIKEWKSTRECGRNGFNQGNVAACCRGELKKYKDFIWKYR